MKNNFSVIIIGDPFQQPRINQKIINLMHILLDPITKLHINLQEAAGND